MLKKLTKLLCEVDEVREDVMELRFGCIVKDTAFNTGLHTIFGEVNRNYITSQHSDLSRPHLERKTDIEDWEIIGNDLEDRHLRMYCERKGIDIDINSYGYIGKDNWTNKAITQLDNKLPFYKQDSKAYEDIYNFLINMKGQI